MTSTASAEPVYAITLHQPWASLIALGVKTVETRSWPAPARLVGQRIAVHAGKRVARRPGDAIERELRARLGENWRVIVLTGAEVGRASGRGRTSIDLWGDFSCGRWLWFLDDVEALPEPVPTLGHQGFWHWDVEIG